MSNTENEIIRLKKLIEKLISSHERNKNILNELREKNIQLESEKETYKKKLKKTEEEKEILKTAKTISLSEEDKTAVKEKINKIVKEIDKSIGLLNE